MLPDYVLSTEFKGAELLYPDNVPTTPAYDLEMGGVALNDPTQGLDLKPWIAKAVPNLGVTLEPIDHSKPLTTQIFGTGVTKVSLAFDTNMQPAIAYEQNGVCMFRWFDNTLPGFVITPYNGARSIRCCTDDKRGLISGTTDVVLSYIKEGMLCYRLQRERYTSERVLKTGIPDDVYLANIGMNTAFRLQFELRLK